MTYQEALLETSKGLGIRRDGWTNKVVRRIHQPRRDDVLMMNTGSEQIIDWKPTDADKAATDWQLI